MAGRVVLTEHARSEAQRRGIAEETVLQVAAAPGQTVGATGMREIRQSRIVDPASGKLHLVRVVVEPGPQEDVIITVYRTSRIRKYWSTG